MCSQLHSYRGLGRETVWMLTGFLPCWLNSAHALNVSQYLSDLLHCPHLTPNMGEWGGSSWSKRSKLIYRKQMLHQLELCKHYSWFTNGFHIHNSKLQTGRKAITHAHSHSVQHVLTQSNFSGQDWGSLGQEKVMSLVSLGSVWFIEAVARAHVGDQWSYYWIQCGDYCLQVLPHSRSPSMFHSFFIESTYTSKYWSWAL